MSQNKTNTILFTPTNEQLVEMAKENPEFHQEVKQKIIASVSESCTKYVKGRLQSRLEQVYNTYLSQVEKKMFRTSSVNYSTVYSFDEKTEKSLTAALENKFAEELEKEFNEYLESPKFKETLKKELERRVIAAAAKSLEEQIQVEAKKLTM